MPYHVVVINTLNGLCWLIYASLRDVILWVTHLSGFSMGLVQLIVHGVYYKTTPTSGDDNKLATTEVQLEEINIDIVKKLVPDKVRVHLQEFDTADNKKLTTADVQLQGIVTA